MGYLDTVPVSQIGVSQRKLHMDYVQEYRSWLTVHIQTIGNLMRFLRAFATKQSPLSWLTAIIDVRLLVCWG